MRPLIAPRHLLKLRRWTRRGRLKRIHRSIRPLHGPPDPDLAPDHPIALCLVRNGEPWIQDFVAHHFGKGFRHLVFLDNGSTDRTVDLLREQEAVTVLRSDLPFQANNILFRRYLIERYARGRWSLTVDVDEFWDYPFSEHLELDRLLRHLRERNVNAVVAHMLDLFAPTLPTEALSLDSYRHYDLSAVTRDGLDCDRGFRHCGFDAVVPGCTALGLYRGGIRAQLFGLEAVWLSKMPLLFFDGELDPLVHQHFSRRARISDTSTVLLHYKLIHTFRAQVEEALRRRQHVHDSWEYTSYRDGLRKDPSPELLRPTTRTLHTVDQLVDEGFLTVSEDVRALASPSHRKPPELHG